MIVKVISEGVDAINGLVAGVLILEVSWKENWEEGRRGMSSEGWDGKERGGMRKGAEENGKGEGWERAARVLCEPFNSYTSQCGLFMTQV